MKLIPVFRVLSDLPRGRSIGGICVILSGEEGSSLFLLKCFPSKTNVLQSLGDLELLLCLDSASSVGFFFSFLTTKPKEMSLEPAGQSQSSRPSNSSSPGACLHLEECYLGGIPGRWSRNFRSWMADMMDEILGGKKPKVHMASVGTYPGVSYLVLRRP